MHVALRLAFALIVGSQPMAQIVVPVAPAIADAVAVLDVDVTPELRAEGMPRDVVRLVQQARKDAGLHVSDRIQLWIETGGEVQPAVETHRACLARAGAGHVSRRRGCLRRS